MFTILVSTSKEVSFIARYGQCTLFGFFHFVWKKENTPCLMCNPREIWERKFSVERRGVGGRIIV